MKINVIKKDGSLQVFVFIFGFQVIHHFEVIINKQIVTNNINNNNNQITSINVIKKLKSDTSFKAQIQP